jgi:hypothetical protein
VAYSPQLGKFSYLLFDVTMRLIIIFNNLLSVFSGFGVFYENGEKQLIMT